MSEELKVKIQDEFSECFTLQEVARLYFEIRIEVERQMGDMNMRIAKEMKQNGVLNDAEE